MPELIKEKEAEKAENPCKNNHKSGDSSHKNKPLPKIRYKSHRNKSVDPNFRKDFDRGF